jgi:predicted HTH transcriptional regulator
MKWTTEEEISPEKLRELRKQVAQGEGDLLEFKRRATYPDKIICEMIAFANTKGGTLFIGISDDGQLSGVKFPDEEIFAIQGSLNKHCRPALPFKLTVLSLGQDRFIVRYIIRESNRKPHAFINPDGSKTVFVRHEDKTVQASREMKEIIKRHSYHRNTKFQYSENEGLLMKYLDEHNFITLDGYRKLTGLNRYKASRSLVTLVLANILQVIPTGKDDKFLIHTKFESDNRHKHK